MLVGFITGAPSSTSSRRGNSPSDGTNYSKEELSEIRKLRKEIADLKEERELLKKATTYFSKVDK